MSKYKKKKWKSEEKKRIETRLSPRKRRMFTALMIIIPVLFLAALEAGLSIFRYGAKQDLFVPTPDDKSEYLGINMAIGNRYFPKGTFQPTPRKDLFLRKKPENGYRIFVLGESSAAGFPYGNNITFPRILNRRLSDTFPERRIEVVNLAMTAINSHALLDFMDEILKQKPDAILIYTGHNEYYGALGVGSVESLGRSRSVIKGFLKLQRLRTMILIRDWINRLKHPDRSPSFDPDDDPMGTEMSRIAKQKNISYSSKLYRSGKQQFQDNLEEIFRKSGHAGVPVLISELVSNVRDQQPFIARENDTLTSAGKMFVTARMMEKRKEYTESRNAYETARDLDALRFRAPEEFNEIIRQIAQKHNGPVVPMKSVFESASPNGLIGYSLICDHLHPNMDGYFLMADAFYNAMKKHGFIEPEWPAENERPPNAYREHWGYTALDSVYAALTVVHLKGGWPFRPGPNQVLDGIVPHSREEEIVLDIIKTGRSTLEMGHIDLGKSHAEHHEIVSAFREYRALVYTVPNLDLFYEPALQLLLSGQQYDQALDFMIEGLKFNSSPFMLKWTGQLYLAFGETDKGIHFLEKARLIVPDDSQLLYNLTRAYYNTRQITRGDKTLESLQKKVPADIIDELKAFRKSVSDSR